MRAHTLALVLDHRPAACRPASLLAQAPRASLTGGLGQTTAHLPAAVRAAPGASLVVWAQTPEGLAGIEQVGGAEALVTGGGTVQCSTVQVAWDRFLSRTWAGIGHTTCCGWDGGWEGVTGCRGCCQCTWMCVVHLVPGFFLSLCRCVVYTGVCFRVA